MLEIYQEAKASVWWNVPLSLFFLFQCCRATHVAPRASYQMESFTARATTWGTKSDTAASRASSWKDTASSRASYHLAAERSGTSPHPFAEVWFSDLSYFLSLCLSVISFFFSLFTSKKSHSRGCGLWRTSARGHNSEKDEKLSSAGCWAKREWTSWSEAPGLSHCFLLIMIWFTQSGHCNKTLHMVTTLITN